MDIHGYSAHILVNGRKVKEYRHDGLTFIEAKNGTEFAVEVKNHLSNRVLAIVSIDGLDVIDGKQATEKSRGYIVNGNNADTFKGWRKSDTEVGAFRFVTSDKSYATEIKGERSSNGVIAIKLLAEKYKHDKVQVSNGCHRPRLIYANQRLYVGPSASASSSTSYSTNAVAVAVGNGTITDFAEAEGKFDMGTGWGTKLNDSVTTTEFEYGNEIDTLEFYYASREALLAMGIPLVTPRQVPNLPKAFEGAGYAQPPKNWRA